MSKQLGPLELDCDAPSYAIVQACSRIGFESPEDVRWCRMGHFPRRRASWRQLFRQSWNWFWGSSSPQEPACVCGQGLPLLEKCSFTLITGREVSYFIGQCRLCRTIFWEDS